MTWKISRAPGELTFDLGARRRDLDSRVGDGRRPRRKTSSPSPRTIARPRPNGAARFRRDCSRAADQYVVRRGAGCTIVAGYPWFTDWGRDTFIALRGLCLATGRVSTARGILLEWADQVSAGMLPNRFPDDGGEPEFNSVDASLWFVIAVQELLRGGRRHRGVTDAHRRRLLEAVDRDRARLQRGHALRHPRGHRRPARRGRARRAADVDGRASRRRSRHAADRQAGRGAGAVAERARVRGERRAGVAPRVRARRSPSFQRRFWNAGAQLPVRRRSTSITCPAQVDASLRPNQIFAVGGLPRAAAARRARAMQIVELVERALLTPLGLRIARARRARLRCRTTTAGRRAAIARITRARCGRG